MALSINFGLAVAQLWAPWGETEQIEIQGNFGLQTLYQSRQWGKGPFGRAGWSNLLDLEKSQAFFRTGNEVGDPLLWELVEEKQYENHTPHLEGFVQLREEWGAVGLEFFQSDHRSDTHKEYRIERVGIEPWKADPLEKMAWFGENLPHHSRVRGAFTMPLLRGDLLLQSAAGWEWIEFPITQRQVPFWGESHDLAFRESRWQLGLEYQRWVEVSKDSLGEFSKFESSLGLKEGAWEFGLRPGFSKNEEANVWWVNPNLTFEKNTKGHFYRWEFKSMAPLWENQVEYFYRWGDFLLELDFGIYWGEESSHPIQSYESLVFEQGGARGFLSLDAERVLGEYALQAKIGGSPFGHHHWFFKVKSGLKRGLIWFAGENFYPEYGYLAGEEQNPSEYWEREGEYRYKNVFREFGEGILGVRIRPDYRILWETELRLYLENEGNQEMDYREPQFSGQTEFSILTPLELRLLGRFKVNSPYEIRNSSPETFNSQWLFSQDFGLLQYLKKRKLQLEVRLLHFLGEEQKLHPNGAPQRFRFLGSLRYFW